MSDPEARVKNRILLFAGFVVIILSLLVVRLFQIQLIKGRTYARAAADQRMMNLPLDLSRGQIYDINMIPLTGRSTVNSLVVFPAIVDDKEKTARLIADIGDLSYAKAISMLERETQPFKVNIDKKGSFQSIGIDVKGVMPITDLLRYDKDSKARHLIGYIDQKDRMGRAGLEKLYHYYLSGQSEISVAAMVDGSKRLIPGLGYRVKAGREQIKSYDLQLTLDYHIQKVVEQVMDRNSIDGAVVVLDVKSGGVAAMASRPDYRQDQVERYLDGTRGELLNKAFQPYNLGSVFKTVVAASVLEHGLVTQFEKLYCPGYTHIGDLQIKCSSFEEGGHGDLNIYGAYARSCNTFFIEMGQRVGGNAIIEMAKRFGFGQATGINQYEEHDGYLPNLQRYHPADVANMSIGQGSMLVTPLQVADMTNTIANNGVRKKPYVVKAFLDNRGRAISAAEDQRPERIISPFIAMEIRRMMEETVDSGTGKKAAITGLGGSAGKTGSAQTGQKNGDREVIHAWFTGFVPRISPRYVITVFAENGRSGGDVAAPIFAEIASQIL
jgi:penicillin-binding protein 2